MKTNIVIAAILLFACTVFAQNKIYFTEPSYKLSINSLQKPFAFSKNRIRLLEKDSTGFQFPLQAGVEYGLGNRNNKFGDKKLRFWEVYVDINLYKHNIFLTLEYGEGRSPVDFEDKFGYGSIGANFRLLHKRAHSIYLHVAGTVNIIPAIVLSSKYLFALNDFIGFSFGGRMIIASDFYIAWLGGFQIFTNR